MKPFRLIVLLISSTIIATCQLVPLRVGPDMTAVVVLISQLSVEGFFDTAHKLVSLF